MGDVTRETKIAITSPDVAPADAFEKMLGLLMGTKVFPVQVDRGNHIPGLYYIQTRPGHGLPAWLTVNFGGDMPLPEDHDVEGGMCVAASEDACRAHAPERYVEISVDTGLGYQAPNGAGAGDLHAWLVREFGHWLDEQGADWEWAEEHQWGLGPDDLHQIGDPDVGALGSTVQREISHSDTEFMRVVVEQIEGMNFNVSREA